MYDLIIVSAKFQHKTNQQGTWVIPGTNDVNQIDHALVNRRIMHIITVMKSMRGRNCDSYHFLVRIRCVHKLMNTQKREIKE
jgi:hypothetical protein